MTSPTPAEEFAALLRGQLDPAPEPDSAPVPAPPARRAPKADPSQGSGAYGKAFIDPRETFGDAITAALKTR